MAASDDVNIRMNIVEIEFDVTWAPFPMLQFGVLQQWLQTRSLTRSPISIHPVLQLLEQFLFRAR